MDERNEMEITCDKCGKVIPDPGWETIRDGDIEHTFFICGSCGAIYQVCVTDGPLRRNIEKYTEMAQKLKEKQCSELFQWQVQKLKEENVKRSRELAALHPLASLFSEE